MASKNQVRRFLDKGLPPGIRKGLQLNNRHLIAKLHEAMKDCYLCGDKSEFLGVRIPPDAEETKRGFFYGLCIRCGVREDRYDQMETKINLEKGD